MMKIVKEDMNWAIRQTLIEEVKDSKLENKNLLVQLIKEEDDIFGRAYSAGWGGGKKYGHQKGLKHGALAAGGVAALIAGASYVYKRFLTKAARNCKEFGGTNKTKCILKYKIKAAQAAIQKLQSSKGKCKTTKNPKSCINKIDLQISKWTQRIKRYKGKLYGLGVAI